MNTPHTQYAKFGVFLPVLNGGDYIAAAVESVIAQECEDWRLIVLDNGSTDQTSEILGRYRDNRICYMRFEECVDIISSWRRISDALRSELYGFDYVTILGHDDLLLPNFLASIGELIFRNPHASLYSTHFSIIDSSGKIVRPCKPIPEQEKYSDFLLSRMWGLRDSFGTGYVFRPEQFLLMGGMPELPSLLYADDLLFARLARLNIKVASPTFAFAYRTHSESTSTGLTATRIEHQLIAVWSFIQHLREGFPDFMKNQAGTNAICCLLAREVLPINTTTIRFFLSKEARSALVKLTSLYVSTARGITVVNWVGTNFVTRSLYIKLKRGVILIVLFRARIGKTFKRAVT